MFSVDQVGLVVDKMDDHVYNERLRYQDIYTAIEDYIVESNTVKSDKYDKRIIIGGSMGVNLLLKRERTFRDFQYILYTEDSLKHANSLANKIAEVIPLDAVFGGLQNSSKDNWVIKMKSSIPDIKYDIYVDNRPLVTIYTLKSDPVKAYNMIEPVTVSSFDGKRQLDVLSPEMNLLDVYRILYSPSSVASWEESLIDEKHLFELLQKRLQILGGSETITVAERTKIENALLEHFVCDNKNVVLIGEHAFKVMQVPAFKDIQTSSNVINVITDLSEEESFAAIKSIIQKAAGREIPVTKNTRSSNVMQDFRLLRTTIKIGADNDQKEVMYMYNSASFDLIPFNTVKSTKPQPFKTIQVANPFVLMRFLLIDLWMIRWVREMKKVNEFFAKKRIHNILSLIIKLRSTMADSSGAIKDEFFSHDDSALNVFQRHRYIGNYINEMVSIRMKQLHMDKRYGDYYPQQFFLKTKSYRVL